jgi:hypothetical protein
MAEAQNKIVDLALNGTGMARELSKLLILGGRGSVASLTPLKARKMP